MSHFFKKIVVEQGYSGANLYETICYKRQKLSHFLFTWRVFVLRAPQSGHQVNKKCTGDQIIDLEFFNDASNLCSFLGLKFHKYNQARAHLS